jgi:predicted nucleotidyltransferase
MIDTIDLSPEHKSRLLKVISEYMPNTEVLVYGSRVNGRSHDGGDIDIALRTHDLEPIDIERLEQLAQAIQSINLPFVVDVLDWVSLPASFQAEILKQFIFLN